MSRTVPEPAAVAAGPLVFAQASAPEGAGIELATRETLASLENALTGLGTNLAQLLDVHCYLSDIADRDEFWSVWDAALPAGEQPLVRVTHIVGLPAGVRLHLDAVARAV